MTNNHLIYQNLCKVIPGGVNSPVRAFKDLESDPIIASSAKGPYLFDANGKKYLDFCCSWGALILGHAHPKVLSSVYQRMCQGWSFGLSTEVEELLAKKVVEHVPSVELVRCVSTGTEATMSAVRLARGYTGKSLIIKFDGNYHGHADYFLTKAGSGVTSLSESSSKGVPGEIVKNILSLPYNNTQVVRKILKEAEVENNLAAVILEPVSGNMGLIPASSEFLTMLREETNQIGALLIFDEVISGFRLGLSGAQGYFGIKPDLTCFGKILGGGFPLAAFGGRKDIMENLAPLGPVYQAGTLSGNPVAVEAGYQTLQLLEHSDAYVQLDRKMRLFIDPIKQVIEKYKVNACVNHLGSMTTLFLGKNVVSNWEDVKDLDKGLFAKFFRYLLSHGIFIPPSPYETWFISLAHTDEDLKKASDLIIDFLKTNK